VSGIAKNAPKTMHVSFFHNKYGKKKLKGFHRPSKSKPGKDWLGHNPPQINRKLLKYLLYFNLIYIYIYLRVNIINLNK
jgi:hypothetical protein